MSTTASIETPTARIARCACGTERPSSPDLAFFEDRSAGTCDHVCANCRYHEVAHQRKAETGERHLSHVCEHFQPMTDGYPTDTFYCGHSGWD